MSTLSRRAAWKPLIAVALFGLLILAHLPGARADSIEIPDGDVDALIEAINTANGTGDTIVLAQNGDYELTAAESELYGPNGLPVITGNVSIEGNGATIRRSHALGTPDFRIFAVGSTGHLHLEEVTVSNGHLSGGFDSHGGGILNELGTLTITTAT